MTVSMAKTDLAAVAVAVDTMIMGLIVNLQ